MCSRSEETRLDAESDLPNILRSLHNMTRDAKEFSTHSGKRGETESSADPAKYVSSVAVAEKKNIALTCTNMLSDRLLALSKPCRYLYFRPFRPLQCPKWRSGYHLR